MPAARLTAFGSAPSPRGNNNGDDTMLTIESKDEKKEVVSLGEAGGDVNIYIDGKMMAYFEESGGIHVRDTTNYFPEVGRWKN